MTVGLPALAALAGLGTLGLWVHSFGSPTGVALRRFETIRPRARPSEPARPTAPTGPIVASTTVTPVEGSWPGFRGADHTNVVPAVRLPDRPDAFRMLWTTPLGEGYAAPAVANSRVFVMDYDEPGKQDLLRCFGLADGKELWRAGYPADVKRNHGMSRTIPTTDGKTVVALTPKCTLICADATTGKTLWTHDLVAEYGTTVPEWYAGQCPLLEDGKVVVAPSGTSLVVAFDAKTGKPLWKTPNPRAWTMTHSSLMPATLAGIRQYVYCGSGGVAGISAKDGKLLWDTEAWVVSTATVPTPVPIDGSRVFLCGGYNAGCMMLSVSANSAKVLWKGGTDVFGSDQQTPVLYEGALYGVAPGGELVCLGLDGKRIWSSGSKGRFGLGPYMIAGGKIVLLNDSGVLTLANASRQAYQPLGSVKVLSGRESWGPIALAGNRLLARDSTSMVCLGFGDGNG